MAPTRGRLRLFRALLALFVLAVAEGASFLALRVLDARGVRFRPAAAAFSSTQREILEAVVSDRARYLDHDPELGWSPRPGAATPRYRANAAGIRADRDYPLAPPAGLTRIAACGDSFVHGDFVGAEHTWERRLEALLPATEVLNFGVSGYGVDQAYLRYRRLARRYGPRIVVIGFMTHDLGRATSTFRLFHFRGSEIPFAKPRFVLENGALRLLPNPIQRREEYRGLLDDPEATLARIGARDFEFQRESPHGPLDVFASVRAARLAWTLWIDPPREPAPLRPDGFFDTRSEAFALNLALFQAFADAVRADGALPLVVFFPGTEDPILESRRSGPTYAALRDAAIARGIPVFDAFDAVDALVARKGLKAAYRYDHYTAEGNAAVAAALAPRLAALAHGAAGDAVDEAGSHEPREASQPAAPR